MLDAGGHQQQGDAGCQSADTFEQGFADDFAARTGNETGRQPAGKEEDAYQRQG